ncbi:hypothetical protein [Parerythrobacter aestuarii]|uniref:hypothetical protein n=1 Tax=Parerythrobacter aestuarii TaxID=3020909 RepID=UPI0024DE1F5B|nr:hypothetical protein [Parerythrobacter aestuarii]
MSLRFLARLTAFGVLLAVAAALGWRYGGPVGRYIAEAQSSTTVDADIDNRALVYRLDRERPLVFVFSQPVERVRLLSQSAVLAEERARPEGFVYAVEARLFDSSGAEVANHLLYLHSDAPDRVFASGESWRFFRNRPEVVAGMDDVVIRAPSPVVRSEWRLVEADPAIEAVDIRVYERRPLLASQALSNFRRRSDNEKLAMTLGNAFPPDMLTEDEMSNIAINLWRPLGPSGIAGRDYQALVLYEGTRRRVRGAREQ